MASEKAVVTEAAQKYGIPPEILWGLYGTETSFGHNVSRSSAGAEGPFQFEPATARSMGVNPHDFKSAAFGAARYLSQYKGRGIGGMLSAYNAGPGGGYQADYVAKTLANAKSYGGNVGTLPVGLSATAGAPTTTERPQAGSTLQVNPKALRTAENNRILLSMPGGKEFAGLLGTNAPRERVPTQAGGTGPTAQAEVPREPNLPQAPGNPNQKPVVPPVKVTLPSYITGKGYPAVEKAKAALERVEKHPVSIPELRKQVGEGIKAPHAKPLGPPIARPKRGR
jgi:hypothetical protein